MSNQLVDSDATALASEESLKTKQLCVVNKLIRQRLGSKFMRKEKYIRSKTKEVKSGIEFAKFDEKACGNNVTYHCKNVDEVLSIFY